MKLPKRIDELLKKKQSYIDSQRGKMEKSVLKLQNQLFSDLIAELIPELDTKDGLILDNAKNYRLISILDKTYRDFQKVTSSIILPQIVSTTEKVVSLSADYFNISLTDIPARFDKVVAESNKLINLKIGLEGDKVFKGGWLDSFFNSDNIGTELKNMTSQAVASNTPMKELIKSLKEKINGTEEKSGVLDYKFNQYAYNLYQQYDAAYNATLGNEFGFTHFIYQGNLIDDSRDFCAAHVNKVWTVEEAEAWKTWTPSQGEYPLGWEVKAKDLYSVPGYMSYAGYDPLLDRGGYNCRHFLGWIEESLALKMRPELEAEGFT